MADVFTKSKRSKVMAAIRSKGNKGTEVKLATVFRQNRITGWRRNQIIIGKPDFVFPKQRLAVFIDGCFWHNCPKHGRRPDINRKYWIPKLKQNSRRDKEVTRSLRRAGWKVLRIWEHELQKSAQVILQVRAMLDYLRNGKR